MEEVFFPVEGATASPEELTYRKPRDLALRLAEGEIDHARFVECKRMDSAETVVFDVRVEVPNRRVHQILRRERIAATFYESDDRPPKAECLRKNFPVVPHLNLHLQEYPRSLCLEEERYEELKRGWTAPRFIHRIREWLKLNAKGELHQEDQHLEPILVDYLGHVVLPADLATNTPKQLHVTGSGPGGQGRWFLWAHRQPPGDGRQSLAMVTSIHCCKLRTHGVIHRCPETLADVAEIAEAAGLDLIAELRGTLPSWNADSLDSLVLLVIVFPQTRKDGGPVEDHDTWCFAITNSVRDIGIALGVWDEMDGELGILLKADDDRRGQDVPVEVLNPCFELTRDAAARLNGKQRASDVKIVGVGVGALGSQVVVNASRSGFGHWTLIDPDRLLPHNVARHALYGSFVGWSKAETVAYAANSTCFADEPFKGLDGDLLRPGARSEEIEAALSTADVIVDMAASVAVQRHLARNTKSFARRLCIFLSPSGSDLVFLAEDTDRRVNVDALEMQYYRALLHDTELAGHIDVPSNLQRYARSCGDITSAMPQDFVALHAAIATRKLKEIQDGDEPFIGVWRAAANCDVRCVSIPIRNVTEFKLSPWTVVLDEGLLERLQRNREDKLPSETGGILLGSFDLERDILYIVDTLPSPPDSEEKADLYIRGCMGLRKAVANVDEKTGGMLEYVGEWHSHPRGAGTRPSAYDVDAFGWLAALMSKDGLPAVMMIVGDAGAVSLFVGSMAKEASVIPEGNRVELTA